MAPEPSNGATARIYHLERRQSTIEPLVTELVRSTAGIQRDIAAMAQDISEIREANHRRDDADAAYRKEMRADAKARAAQETTTARFRITTTIAIVMAILGAATIVAMAIS